MIDIPEYRSHERGATLIELLVAVVILAIVAVAAAGSLGTTTTNDVSAQARNHRSAALEAIAERIRSNTSWMSSTACTATVTTSTGTCNVAYLVDGSGTGDFATPHPALDDDRYGSMSVVAEAHAVDSSDDGRGGADADGEPIDYYELTVSLAFDDADRLGVDPDPVVSRSTVDPQSTSAVGNVTVQLCRVWYQQDDRQAIGDCNVARDERMSPPYKWNSATGGTSAEHQAYTCAHPSYFRAASASGDVPGKCFSADPPFSEGNLSYQNTFVAFGLTWYDKWADYRSRNDNLPSSDRDRYVTMRTTPIPNIGIQLTGTNGAAVGTTVNGTTNASGKVTFTDLPPGRYRFNAGNLLSGTHELSTTMSVPGNEVIVDAGVTSRATLVYVPAARHSLRIAKSTLDHSYPWHPWLQVAGWRNPTTGPAPSVAVWNPAWGNWGGGNGAPYVTSWGLGFNWNGASPQAGPGPWPLVYQYNEAWLAFQADGSPQPLCVIVRAVPWGRIADPATASKQVCEHDIGVNDRYMDPNPGNDGPLAVTGLKPGLYSYEIQGIPGFVWDREGTPGFIFINENGTTVPSSTNWATSPRIVYHGCKDDRRALARWLFDPTLEPSCGAQVDSSSGGDTGGGVT